MFMHKESSLSQKIATNEPNCLEKAEEVLILKRSGKPVGLRTFSMIEAVNEIAQY